MIRTNHIGRQHQTQLTHNYNILKEKEKEKLNKYSSSNSDSEPSLGTSNNIYFEDIENVNCKIGLYLWMRFTKFNVFDWELKLRISALN